MSGFDFFSFGIYATVIVFWAARWFNAWWYRVDTVTEVTLECPQCGHEISYIRTTPKHRWPRRRGAVIEKRGVKVRVE